MQHLLKLFVLLGLAFMLSACQPSEPKLKFVATNITGADFGQTLNLIDHNGKSRTFAEFQGKVVALFFGYTHCPDVCPSTMTDMKQTMNLLGDRADEVQVLFVTLDPARDTQQVLARFVPSFDARFLGLYGDETQIGATAKTYKIFVNKVPTKKGNDYTIDHSAGMYVFDKLGKIRLYVDYGQKPADIASDIKQLL